MIAHLSGTLLSKQATSVILDVAGVGYEVTIPVSTFYELEEPGASIQLRIYTHVREDALQLYGFKTARERELFLRLISVSGIGPKLGITLLSGMSADEMIASIRTNNLARLTLIPGVGRKTAERLVMELRDKVASLSSTELEEELGEKTRECITHGRYNAFRRAIGPLEPGLSTGCRGKSSHLGAERGKRHFCRVNLTTEPAQAGKRMISVILLSRIPNRFLL